MTNRIMLRAYANENTVSIRTVSARMKSPQHFYICYEEFDLLQQTGRIITSDIHSFAKISLNEKHDRIEFQFTWLSGRSYDHVEGMEQIVNLRWSTFQTFLRDCRQPDGPKTFKAISLDISRGRPRLVFDGNRENLHAAIDNPHIRHKLGKALMSNFNWPDADEIHLYNDFVPYSFFFREIRGGRARMCGGLILHGQENMSKAYYGIHIHEDLTLSDYKRFVQDAAEYHRLLNVLVDQTRVYEQPQIEEIAQKAGRHAFKHVGLLVFNLAHRMNTSGSLEG